MPGRAARGTEVAVADASDDRWAGLRLSVPWSRAPPTSRRRLVGHRLAGGRPLGS